MARRAFFSFHYQPDVQRAHVVRNSWVTKPDREDAGFFDSSVFESKKRTSDDALKSFLADGLKGSSVTAVLYTKETAHRRWVRYELLKSFVEGKGILAIDIHTIADLNKKTTASGPNPLNLLGAEISNQTCCLKEKQPNGTWRWAKDVASVPVRNLPYSLGNRTNFTLGTLFNWYDWKQNNGYTNMSKWIDDAAKLADR